jgi:pyruvate/oxaloacetate carboxyltransferase
MAHIEFLDETLRDGQQSLWGMRMQAGMALPAAGDLDKTGFRRIELTGSNHFEVLVRYCRENPWQMLDALVEAMPFGVKARLVAEKTAIGFYLSGHLFDEVEAEVRQFAKLKIEDLIDSRDTRVLAAIVTDLRVINGNRGKVIIFKLFNNLLG